MLFVNRNANLNSLFVFKSIDVEDATKIQARFLEFVSNKTVIITTHRMCTVAFYSVIFCNPIWKFQSEA
jgi:hypothetical protein